MTSRLPHDVDQTSPSEQRRLDRFALALLAGLTLFFLWIHASAS